MGERVDRRVGDVARARVDGRVPDDGSLAVVVSIEIERHEEVVVGQRLRRPRGGRPHPLATEYPKTSACATPPDMSVSQPCCTR